MDFSEIRRISIDSITSDKEGCGVLSNLNWKRYERQLKEISKIIPKNSKILEIGCGRGMITAMIKKINPESDVIGIDLQKFSSWDFYEKNYNVKYFVGDATDLQFKDEEFDTIISFGVVEHVTNDQKFIKENLRVLKRGGVGFILNIPNKYSINEFFAQKIGIWSHEIKYNRSEIKNLLKSNGIERFVIKRRFLIPAQVCRVNNYLGKSFDKFYGQLDFIDKLLCATPMNLFSQVFDVFYRNGV